jgi:bifunctional UDP-N-acetylglucosamine pyrophosphorylase/glucosamine-1-phosphate N-acetyltransferase
MKSYREYGIVKVDADGRILNILEKPSEEEAREAMVDNAYLVNSGPLIFNLKVFEYLKRTPISPAGEYWVTDTIKLMINDGLNVLAYRIPFSVFWRDIGRPETRIEAEKYVQEIGLAKINL